MSTGKQIAEAAMKQRTVIPSPSKGERGKSLGFKAVMLSALFITVLGLAVLIVDIVSDGSSKFGLDLITNQPSKILPESSGVQSALLGTLYLMGLVALVVVPLGIATAIYLEEYADSEKRINRIIEVNIQNLAAVPSVVYGILGLALFSRQLSLGNTLITGALTLSLLVLPVVIIVSREALRAVPPSISEGSLALGATKWQTIWKQVLPGSISGIATGVILALSRAIGETAPLLIIGAALSPRFNPDGLTSEFTALPIQIYSWSKDTDVENFLPLASAAIMVLMILLLAMNSVAIFLRNRYEQKW